jgi:peroxiredoxin
MNTYYTLLEVDPGATREEIEQAYQAQRERYNPERVATMDQEIRQVAEQRVAEIEQAYQILSDPQQREQYDGQIGLAITRKPQPLPAEEPDPEMARPQPTRNKRDYVIAAGGVVGAILLIMLVWAMGGDSGSGAPAVPQSNRPAPEFTLPTPDGGEVRLSDYRGSIVLINFWGSWCEPCRNELPELQTAYEQLRDQGFVVIGIDLFDNEFDEAGTRYTREDIQQFVEQQGLTYPIALDVQGEVSNAYRIFPIPTSYFVDREGTIRYVIPREITAEEIVQWFTELNQDEDVGAIAE